MVHDWAADVRKYIPRENEAAIDGIIRHVDITLRRRDGSFIAGRDKSERDRVRDSFLKKRLGLSLSDTELDRAIADIWQKMHNDRDKSRINILLLAGRKVRQAFDVHVTAAPHGCCGVRCNFSSPGSNNGVSKVCAPSKMECRDHSRRRLWCRTSSGSS